MVFSSVEFLFLFLPIFLFAQTLLPYRNFVFAVFSVFFYFVGEGWYTAIVLTSAAANYGFGRLIDRQEDPVTRKWMLALGITTNVLPLLYYKYAWFLIGAVAPGMIGPTATAPHLPLGISFFTFHAISYLTDIYRRDARAERSFTNLALYILMFPQLIAGPILRFHTIAGQLRRRVISLRHLYFGFALLCFGLGQKTLIADPMAAIADPLFARALELNSLEAWIAAIAYTLQIYFDFSGYSNMAIGLGWMTGFHFPKNFNFPYISTSITEFWRRWHMSLSQWFRDYLYIPLGGNRASKLKTYRNLFIVFLFCGFWHGASWTFVVWGLYHGALLVVERVGLAKWLTRSPTLMRHGYALLAIMIGWVIFRATTLQEAGAIIRRLFIWSVPSIDIFWQAFNAERIFACVLALAFVSPVLIHRARRMIAIPLIGDWPRRAAPASYALGGALALVTLVLATIKIMGGAYSPFIYFRF